MAEQWACCARPGEADERVMTAEFRLIDDEEMIRGCAQDDPASLRVFAERYGASVRERATIAATALHLPGVDVVELQRGVARSVAKRWMSWLSTEPNGGKRTGSKQTGRIDAGTRAGSGPRSSNGRPVAPDPVKPQVADMVSQIEVEDLVLAVSCSRGIEAAWEVFDARYADFIRISARQFARHPSDVAEIVESFYADLFLPRAGGGNPLAGFQGWAKLKTWLRTVLVYRVNDHYNRSGCSEVQMSVLEDGIRSSVVQPARPGTNGAVSAAGDQFHARDFRDRVDRALGHALRQLSSLESELIVQYYVEGRTVVELGRHNGVHKASVSRWLKRVRGQILQSLRRDLGNDFPVNAEELGDMFEVLGLSDATRSPGLDG